MRKPDESTRLLDSKDDVAPATTPFAALTVAGRTDESMAADSKIRLPQAIAHRGYKAAFPENSMAAFRSAVDIGAHAIETDLHLSRDGVVVLSHDASLKRCFGIDKKVADCDWSYLSTLTTLREPKQSLPRLVDLLEYLARPEAEHIWLLLDVKTHDDASQLLRGIAQAVASVPPKRPWTSRVMIGCWDANYVRLSLKHLSGFPLAYIGVDLAYAHALLATVPNVHFNLLQQTLAGPCGARFLARAHRRGRAVFVWTVNTEAWMEWDIRRGLDGVVTDDPKLFLEVCDRFREDHAAGVNEARRPVRWLARRVFDMAWLYVLLGIYLAVVRSRYGGPRRRVEKALSK